MPDEAIAYRALALQLKARSVAGMGESEARLHIKSGLDALRRSVESSIAFIGRDCKLAVLPEYVLTGFPLGEPIPKWAEIAGLDMDGPEYEALAAISSDNGIFLAGNVYERDPNFPGIYFQACFVIDPSGALVLRYRRLNSMFTPTPHDLWDRYVDIYGLDGVFPVAKTAIGNLAAIASEEILFPELARCLVMRGAEVFLHPTSETGSPDVTPKDVAKRARAIENLAYVVSANTAGIEGSPIPEQSADGGSQIVDHEGRVLVRAGQGESMVANCEIDIGALRRARRRPGMANLLSRNRFDLYAQSYASTDIHSANGFNDVPIPDRSYFISKQKQIIDSLIERGLA